MTHLLCITFKQDASAVAVARWIDNLGKPFEYQDLPDVSENRLLVIRYDDIDELGQALQTVPDRSIMTAFACSLLPFSEVHDGVR